MAADDPDLKTFKDWEEAFQYPIPSIRKLEQRFRNDAEENRQKLRTIVGASYRDLLGTADRIIEMDKQMRIVETSLGLAGQKCNSRAVERIFSNSAKFNAQVDSKNASQFAISSQLSMLQRCASIVSRLLKKGGSPLVAAKVLVLSSLTHKVLSQSEPDSDLIESIRHRLASLRRRLRHVIDLNLSDPDADWKGLVDHMCALSLTTSATPTNVLRHFHRVRLQAIESCLVNDEASTADPSKAVKLLVKTAQVSQAIFPKRLSEALVRLKDVPLLQQQDITSLVELELDIHGRWIAEELQNYTPWPRHDELQKPEADKQLKSWTKQAVKAFIIGLQKGLLSKNNFEEVVQGRKAIFEAWPWTGRGLPGLDSEEIVDELREIINERLFTIIKSSTKNLESIFSQLSSSWAKTGPKPLTSLWDSTLVSTDASSGASKFKKTLISVYNGEDSISYSTTLAYDKWIEGVTSLMSGIKTLKEDRWDIDFGEDDDELDGESRRTLLSEDDPRELEDALSEALQTAFQTLQGTLKNLIAKATEGEEDMQDEVCVIYLRVLRELSRRTIGEGFSRKLQITPQIGSDMVMPLQTQVAQKALGSPIASYERSLSAFSESSRVVGRLLWEGTPPLPIQPSPTVYRFLRDLSSSMAAIGVDLWSSGTVRFLKQVGLKKLRDVIHSSVEAVVSAFLVSSNTNGHKAVTPQETKESEEDAKQKEAPAEDQQKEDPKSTEDEATEKAQSETAPDVKADKGVSLEKVVQLLFDYFYAECAFAAGDKGSDNNVQPFIDAIKRLNGELDSADVSRLSKSAGDYWKRSYLMFALLSDS